MTMNFFLKHTLTHATVFCPYLDTPPSLPRSLVDDSSKQRKQLDLALNSLINSFYREGYSCTKDLLHIWTVILYMIVSRELRGVDILETFLDSDQEKAVAEGPRNPVGKRPLQ